MSSGDPLDFSLAGHWELSSHREVVLLFILVLYSIWKFYQRKR